jgi:hypothetical protein
MPHLPLGGVVHLRVLSLEDQRTSAPIRQWGLRMAEYRAYFVGSDEHFTGYAAIVCRDDKEAIEQAKEFLDDHSIELWCGARLVRRISHKA